MDQSISQVQVGLLGRMNQFIPAKIANWTNIGHLSKHHFSGTSPSNLKIVCCMQSDVGLVVQAVIPELIGCVGKKQFSAPAFSCSLNFHSVAFVQGKQGSAI